MASPGPAPPVARRRVGGADAGWRGPGRGPRRLPAPANGARRGGGPRGHGPGLPLRGGHRRPAPRVARPGGA
eukprot:4886208-Lingulodinium_polyedra.AAC.1